VFPLGVVLVAVGVIGELAGGEFFRDFFNWHYMRDHKGEGETLKVVMGRAGIVLGAVLMITSGLRAIV
jgi:hypothetical protein